MIINLYGVNDMKCSEQHDGNENLDYMIYISSISQDMENLSWNLIWREPCPHLST